MAKKVAKVASAQEGKKEKKSCPVSREKFREDAPAGLSLEINGSPMIATKKEYDTGSLGWHLNGKTVVEIGGTLCDVQVGVNLTLVHSKELPE